MEKTTFVGVRVVVSYEYIMFQAKGGGGSCTMKTTRK